ncbi:hypothetical protein ACFQBY_06630 [Promicromonospora citrea]|uniref:DUF2550 family protein n=1 Tax=Promicromonospora citrea TaxID=43677 RepID=A0A8H9L0V2_9MICO|nr:hypothetical protein [Promicromonospora citrea]NNH51683.1 hypothetical protein [Promicromonospora citrea]GGM12903.1 hypothetical protein GCM10010102_05660 [Promicromonospora citrea]
MSEDLVGLLFIVAGVALAGAFSRWLFRRAARGRVGSGVVEVVLWAPSGRLPGLSRKKKWIKAKVTTDEAGRLVWVKPAGEPVSLTLRSRDPRPRNKSDLFFLDPGTPVWEALTDDDQELRLVIPQESEHRFVEQFPVHGQFTTQM